MESTILGIVHSAIYCRHTVAEEVDLCLKRAEEGYKDAVTRTARTAAQHEMYARVANRNKERLAELTALKARFASFRGELPGELPLELDRSAKCDPELADYARSTEDSVFRAAVRTLGGGA